MSMLKPTKHYYNCNGRKTRRTEFSNSGIRQHKLNDFKMRPLYMRLYPLVRLSVSPTVRWSIGPPVSPSVCRQLIISNAENERCSLWKSWAQSNIEIAECTSCAECAYCAKYAHGHIVGMLGLVTEDLMLTQCRGHSSQMVEEPRNLWLSTHIWCKMLNSDYFLDYVLSLGV